MVIRLNAMIENSFVRDYTQHCFVNTVKSYAIPH